MGTTGHLVGKGWLSRPWVSMRMTPGLVLMVFVHTQFEENGLAVSYHGTDDIGSAKKDR